MEMKERLTLLLLLLLLLNGEDKRWYNSRFSLSGKKNISQAHNLWEIPDQIIFHSFSSQAKHCMPNLLHSFIICKLQSDIYRNMVNLFTSIIDINLTSLLILPCGCNSQENPGLREDTYELCYNSACLSLGQNDVEVAQQKLKKAEGNQLALLFSCNIHRIIIIMQPCACFSHAYNVQCLVVHNLI